MNGLQVFKNTEFGELNILMIDGNEYFPVKQCATKLGYTYPKEAIRLHCKEALKERHLTKGGWQVINLIPESDLYRLITRSTLPAAKRFEKWIFEEILPTIRKTGEYKITPPVKTTLTPKSQSHDIEIAIRALNAKTRKAVVHIKLSEHKLLSVEEKTAHAKEASRIMLGEPINITGEQSESNF